jgi:NodT family efflux transporter outer membrane factor (OMF) lipoprotein
MVVAGCQSIGPKPRPSLTGTIPPAFGQAKASDGMIIENWLSQFQDPQLERLINEALAHNADLQATGARLQAAEADAVRAGARRKPMASLEVYGSRAQSLQTSAKRQVKKGLSLDISWELDIWGRLAAERDAARSDFEAGALDYQFARQSLAAQVAKAWFLAIASKLQLSLMQSFVENYRQQLELTQLRYDLGESTLQDLNLIRAELANARQEHVQTTALRQQALRHLELLVGRYPGAEIEVAENLPALDLAIPAGLPSELLDRRPDVAAAWKRVWAAYKLKEAAVKARLPKLALTTSVGKTTTQLSDIVDMTASGTLVDLAANLLAPIYEGGRLKADVDVADAEQQTALAAYTRVALTAFAEVEAALSNIDLLQRRIHYLGQMVEENRNAWDLMRLQYESGESDMISLLLV